MSLKLTSNVLVTPAETEQDCLEELFEAVNMSRRL